MQFHKYMPRIIHTAACAILILSACYASPSAENRSEDAEQSTFTRLHAVVLGAVEGLTEYLPVSSTGHLYVSQRFLGIGDSADEKEAADAYAICIQAGAILAVLSLYFGRVRGMARGLIGRDEQGRRLLWNTVAAFVPAALIGIALEKQIKAYLFGFWPIVLAWFVGGIVILIVSRRKHHLQKDAGLSLETLTLKQALAIGLIQCLAMWPGVSRSLVTIVGGVLVGLSVPAAVEFSFLLGLVTLGAATSYEAVKQVTLIISTFGWINPLIGFVVAWITAVIAVKWMVGYLNRHGLAIFGYYRMAIALIAVTLILLGVRGL